jgi:hypothetical protein
MVNKKTAGSSHRTTRTTAATTRKKTTKTVKRPVRRVVDPMMVSPVRAMKDDSRLTEVAIDNDVDFTEKDDDDFLSDSALYDIDDLYDEKGNLIMDEADEILREEEYHHRNHRTMPEMKKKNSNLKNKRNKALIIISFNYLQKEFQTIRHSKLAL